jgi:hypothetical protein
MKEGWGKRSLSSGRGWILRRKRQYCRSRIGSRMKSSSGSLKARSSHVLSMSASLTEYLSRRCWRMLVFATLAWSRALQLVVVPSCSWSVVVSLVWCSVAGRVARDGAGGGDV